MNYNKAILIGYLTRDPELRYADNGTPVCTFSVATNRAYTDVQGEQHTEATFHHLVAFGKTGEAIAQYMRKGSLMMVEGRLQNNTWEQDGQKHQRTEIVVERVQFGPKPQSEVEREPGSDDEVAF